MVLENYGQDYEELDVVLDLNVQQTCNYIQVTGFLNRMLMEWTKRPWI